MKPPRFAGPNLETSVCLNVVHPFCLLGITSFKPTWSLFLFAGDLLPSKKGKQLQHLAKRPTESLIHPALLILRRGIPK